MEETATTLPKSISAFADKTLTGQVLTLPSDRILSYATCGSPTRPTLFYLHALFGSRIEGAEVHPAALELGICSIAMDRPGIGLSRYDPKRLVVDWAAEVEHLAQHLELKTFRVIGRSGGGADALACANALSRERLLGVGIVYAITKPSFLKRLLIDRYPWHGMVRPHAFEQLRMDAFAAGVGDRVDGYRPGTGPKSNSADEEAYQSLGQPQGPGRPGDLRAQH
ncbi:hypothetical protein MMC11_003663 [Xylographa trunciseda]|nr:hypothetical protein [Xylographa trunciseda]